MISTRPIAPHEWAPYRDLRLQALRDAPHAFGSTWEAEAKRADESWSTQITSATSGEMDLPLFAFNEAQACGLIWCKLSATEPGVAYIYQMWVHPAARGQGAGRALLVQALAWAEGRGARCVRLGVTHADSPAMRLYRAHGFRPVGDIKPLREGSELMAQTMERVSSEPVAR
ncbi:GNAT family N-acetyltransferase [Comamonas composti]|uniref:GNAT family N-acetyltransferase n=1 Tax=Comamonas composti TaxID=408558 RepID=UPI00047A71EE|nr:GNAT family N-acetyltransferase [Comamonas composti]